MIAQGDVDRLCAYLGIARAAFEDGYLEQIRDRKRLRTVNDRCIFFSQGCSVHPAKPAVCRAWPFFQGNMVDESSWRMAQNACPGINPDVAHDAFVREGLEYIRDLNLESDDSGPNALNLKRLRPPSQP